MNYPSNFHVLQTASNVHSLPKYVADENENGRYINNSLLGHIIWFLDYESMIPSYIWQIKFVRLAILTFAIF